ncbi:MAG TPA: HEAT repeat domain-containing protein [Bryobacteraceae bacterium]
MVPLKWACLLWAAAALAAQGRAATQAECTELLQNGLADKNPETRKQAVIALSLAAQRGPLLERLQEMLQDKDVEVRQAAVVSLAEVKNKAATAALHKALEDDVPEVSFAAAKALWARHDPAGKAALLAVLEGESKTSSNFFSKQKRDALRMMHTPRTTFLFALRQGVAFAPVPGLGEGIASMEGILTDAGVSGRASAALMLGHDQDPAVLEALKDALSDKDWRVRAAAVHSLSLRNDPALKKELEPLLKDEKEAVRLRAAAGYLRLSIHRAGPGTRKRLAAAPSQAGAEQQKK